MAPHSSTLAWKIPWTVESGRLQSMGSWIVEHDWVTSLSLSLSCIGEGNGNPLQYSCLGNPRDGRAWWAAVYGIAQSQTRLKWLSSSRLVIAFLPRSKCLLFSWLQSPSTVISEHKKIKSITVSTVSPLICHEVMEPDAMIFVFWMLSFKPAFSHSSFTFIKGLFCSSSLFCHKGGVICISEVIDISFDNLDSSLSFIQPGISDDVLCI